MKRSPMTNNLFAKKSLGQNWLVNEGVLDRMVATAHLGPTDTVLEIGPGQGALTKRLVATGARIIAIEKDHRLIEPLMSAFSSHTNLQIIEGDALEISPETLGLEAGHYLLVANLPYYITSHLIRLMLENWPSPSIAILMVQEEVAKRITARPPDMNMLALSVQLYGTPTIVMRVSRGSFRPTPDVDSAVLSISVHHLDPSRRTQNERILSLAKKAFGQKRKQLGKTVPSDALEKAGIAPTIRPQELGIGEWQRIVEAIN